MLQGRYGNDYLNRALGILTVFFAVLGMFFKYTSPVRPILAFISALFAGLMLFRMLSRDFNARRLENEKFFSWWMPFRTKLKGFFQKGSRVRKARVTPTFAERRKYKYFICPQCAQRLRVPRGKGKLRVTCTRCANKFEIKS